MKTSHYITSSFLIGALVVVFIGLGLINSSSNQATLPVYFIANQNYKSGNFTDAITGYYQALRDNPSLIQKEPLIRFKIGYGYFKTGDFQKSHDIFQKSQESLEVIQDYLEYFQLLSAIELHPEKLKSGMVEEMKSRLAESPVTPLLDSIQAAIFLNQSRPDSAIPHLEAMLRSGYFNNDGVYLKLIEIYQDIPDTSRFRETAYLFLKRYPFHDASEMIYKNLMNSYNGKINLYHLKRLFKYLLDTKQYLAAADLLEKQAPLSERAEEQEYCRWLPSELLYRQGEYGKVLDWSLKERETFKIQSIRRNVDLNIARCYLRLGNVDLSIKYYLEFQKRYPRDALSPEVLWKVGWLYEGKNDLKRALEVYQKLIKSYPRSSFFSEAYFRIGLSYYSQNNYSEARKSWEKAYSRERSQSQKDRITYWIGKCYGKEKDFKKQAELYIELAGRPVDSFYNLKAFFLTNNGKDIHKKINEAFWELHQENATYLPEYIDQFRRALLVEEILGKNWGDRELRSLDKSRGDWQEIFALGELYEKMQNYGFAYRRFRNVFDKKFLNADLNEMMPVFKKLYPLYYAAEIDSFSSQFSVSPELIWSVMKKESAFAARVISYANAYGLMQLLPGTASQIAPRINVQFISTEQLFEPVINIQMGTYYLSSLLERYDGNYVMALAGYNAGPHRVDRWIKRYPTDDDDLFMENLEFEQTRVYVRTCLKYFWIYQTITRPGEVPAEIVNYPVDLRRYL